MPPVSAAADAAVRGCVLPSRGAQRNAPQTPNADSRDATGPQGLSRITTPRRGLACKFHETPTPHLLVHAATRPLAPRSQSPLPKRSKPFTHLLALQTQPPPPPPSGPH